MRIVGSLRAAYQPDVVQRLTGFATTTAFKLLAETKDPSKMTGAMRVAYGPLDAAPRLERPLVMVPGFTMEATSFDRFAQHLATNEANGPVTVYVTGENRFRDGSATGAILSAVEVRQRKIFALQYQDPFKGPTAKAPELAKALRDIAARTGAQDLSAVTHSEGATDMRLYLDSLGTARTKKWPGVHDLLMIGPASRGTLVGNIGAVVGRVKNAQIAAGELSVGSPLTESLLKKWPAHRERINGEVKIVGLKGVPTLTTGGLFGVTIGSGDGFMTNTDISLPGAKQVLLQGPHSTLAAHLWEVQYSGVLNEVMKSLRR